MLLALTGGGTMNSTEQDDRDFTLVIDHPITDEETDDLFESGCDDATPEVGSTRTQLHFHRRAASLIAAIVSAVLDVERANLIVAGVGTNDLVDLPEIAARVGRSRESIRLLAAGKRGPGDFPRSDGGLYSWVMVRAWFARYAPDAVGSPDADDLDYDRTIAAADHVVRARALMNGHIHGLEALLPA